MNKKESINKNHTCSCPICGKEAIVGPIDGAFIDCSHCGHHDEIIV
jgi:transcription elongation factor Elf1